jgi:hypothetical protein
MMTNVVVVPYSWTPPDERPDCAALEAGACTTTPVARPAPVLPVTGGRWLWAAGLGLALAAGGLALVAVSRWRVRR